MQRGMKGGFQANDEDDNVITLEDLNLAKAPFRATRVQPFDSNISRPVPEPDYHYVINLQELSDTAMQLSETKWEYETTVLHVLDFPASYKTVDILNLFKDVVVSIKIKWINDTEAKAVFQTTEDAKRAFENIHHPFIKVSFDLQD
jgi:hypothetical protein